MVSKIQRLAAPSNPNEFKAQEKANVATRCAGDGQHIVCSVGLGPHSHLKGLYQLQQDPYMFLWLYQYCRHVGALLTCYGSQDNNSLVLKETAICQFSKMTTNVTLPCDPLTLTSAQTSNRELKQRSSWPSISASPSPASAGACRRCLTSRVWVKYNTYITHIM